MSASLDINHDIKVTNNLLLNKAHVTKNDTSWLNHSEKAGVIDYAVLKGASMTELITLTGQTKERMKNHFYHLKTVHGVIVEEENGIYKITGTIDPTLLNEELYKLKEQFLKEWPISRLQSMRIDEYTNLDKTSFCYWLEHITRDLGSIVGGSSYKFGIYKRNVTTDISNNTNRATDGEYAWFKKYGETREEAFETIRSLIITIAQSSIKNELENIDDIDLGHAYKWKITFLYGDYNCINAFKLDALRVIASNLSIPYSKNTPVSEFNREILKLKPDQTDYYTYTDKLWKQYESRLKDVKKDFAKWLNKNTFDSYRAYLGHTTKSIIEKLDEINDFFDELDFFLVDPTKINGLVSTISFLLSKKERLKKPDFVEYDAKNSNGIPKAILGKNNYIKFLKSRYDFKPPNYWVFQGNPKVFDFKTAIKEDLLDDWTVSAHKDKIKIGDKVIFWLTGQDSGCYALGEITKAPEIKLESGDDHLWKKEDKNDLKAGVRITHNLFDNPITQEQIKDIEVLNNLKVGFQGTNFNATEVEYETLLELIERDEDSVYSNIVSKFQKEKFEQYISILREFVTVNNLTHDDDRTSFNVRKSKNRLVLIIGSRYAIMLEGQGKETKFSFISDKIVSDNFRQYNDSNGNPEESYSNVVDDIELYRSEILDGSKIELNRRYKSPYRKFENIDFINDVFNLSLKHRKKVNATTSKLSNMIVNQILCGPPGTGKTFYLKDQLFDQYTVKETSISDEKNFETTVSNLTWWQVIALALLEIGTARVNDILANRWVSKKASLSESKNVRATLWGTLQMHTIIESKNVAYTQRQAPFIFDKNEDKSWSLLDAELAEQAPELNSILDDVNNFEARPNIVIENYVFVTFHQSFAYEDFIEGIKPIIPETDVDVEESKDLGFTIEDGVFKKLCKRAKIDPDNRYAIFIDEINRGNVSAIFGELITLIEVDKRAGAENHMSIKLPYSKKEFSVPANVDIYGTMNTADRSVEALDTALRRRFEFKEMMPNELLIDDRFVETIQLSEVLRTINQRIELLLDRDHTIGHSYFMSVKSPEDLANAFNNKIVPLLQEYFYGDYGKIGLVLGNGFVKINDNKSVSFSSFKYEDKDQFITPAYILKPIDKSNTIDAINQLLETKEA